MATVLRAANNPVYVYEITRSRPRDRPERVSYSELLVRYTCVYRKRKKITLAILDGNQEEIRNNSSVCDTLLFFHVNK